MSPLSGKGSKMTFIAFPLIKDLLYFHGARNRDSPLKVGEQNLGELKLIVETARFIIGKPNKQLLTYMVKVRLCREVLSALEEVYMPCSYITGSDARS